MIVDSSAIMAVLQGEPEAGAFSHLMAETSQLRISAATLVEISVACLRKGEDVDRALTDFISGFELDVVPLDRAQAQIARGAFIRFGKGRHRAKLNFGDTFSYALAMHLSEPLLFKGADFLETDVTPAV